MPLSDTQASFIDCGLGVAAGPPKTTYGHVAEWLRSGLQNRLPRFNSGRGLQVLSPERASKLPNAAPGSDPFRRPGEQIHNACETGRQHRKLSVGVQNLVVLPLARTVGRWGGRGLIMEPVSFRAVRLKQYRKDGWIVARFIRKRSDHRRSEGCRAIRGPEIRFRRAAGHSPQEDGHGIYLYTRGRLEALGPRCAQ